MKAQFKYAFLQQWHLRKIRVLLPLMVFYPALALCGRLCGKNPDIEVYVMVAFSAFLFMTISLFLCIATDFRIIRNMLSVHHGYMEFLVPVAGWKRLLAKIVSMSVADSVCFVLNAAGFMLNIYLIEDDMGKMMRVNPWLVVNAILTYFCIMLLFFLAAALHHSYFSGIRLGWLINLFAVLGIAYLLNVINLLIIPFSTHVSQSRLQISVTLNMAAGSGLFVFLLLKLCKAGLLFGVTSYIMERKINI